MIAWGEALVKELAARRCIVFFGSGASAGCEPTVGGEKPPNWPQLLRSLNRRVGSQESQAIAEELIVEKRYLEAAEIIVAGMITADYHDAMRQIFEVPRYRPSRIHEAILRIDPKVVVTTNFDTIYDTYCRQELAANGYNVFKYHDSHLVSQLRSPIRCVIKSHGCVGTPDSMVLTRSDFFRAKQVAPHFYATLDALFLTHTILFIGYSLADPDIQLALENVNISAPSSHRHYFVCEAGEHEALKRAKENAFNLHILEFERDNFAELEASLADLADRVIECRELYPEL